MATFQGKRVSPEWAVVLTEAEKHVKFRLNDGQRTIAIQQQRVRDHGVWSPSNPHGAALPNANAPHIKNGRADHALDIDMYVGDGVQGVAKWLRSQGATVGFTVPTEGWHIEVPLGDLLRLYKRFKKPDGYTDSEWRWINEYDNLKKAGKDKARRSVLRRVMKEQRKRIWREAKKDGWKKNNRRARYRSLLVRSLP